MQQRINVTKSFLPPLEAYQSYVEQIWQRGHLTNQGPLLQEFEQQVTKYLEVSHLHFVTNGTLALQLALRALKATGGEVITTPFSYVATVSSILWEGCKPVFVDIEPRTFCIDASKIESAITNKTKAILAVHVFGRPCNVEAIEAIARKHHLKVIYDAAHCFGVKYRSKSIMAYGDASICSFHATKVFHTIEGGAVVLSDKKISDKVELMKRFGHNGDEHLTLGLNAKASEFQAAMGLCNLQYVDAIMDERKKLSGIYTSLLGQTLQVPPPVQKELAYNYAYYPVLFRDSRQLLGTFAALEKENIFPRRYFYPSLNKLPYITGQACPISEDIASRVACLPLYSGLAEQDVVRICRVIQRHVA